MDPQDPQNSNPTPPSPGERAAPETPPEGQPGMPQSAPPPQQPFPPTPSTAPPPTGAYPAQTTSQPPWPPYPQGGQEGYPQQSQPYSPPPYQPPMQGQPPPGAYMPDGTPAPPTPGAQGGYYPPDYRPPSPGGYSTHEQPTQAYGQGQGPGQGGYQGYPGYPSQQGSYPPQQGGTQQYNVNAPKKGMPIWVWGVIGLLVIALVGGGLFFFVFSPKSNAPAGNTTPQPTVAAGQPTTAPGQPTTAPGQPTPVPPTASRNTPVPPTAVRPTSVAPATLAPTTEHATVGPRPTTGPGQGGFVGTPRDAVVTFLGYLRDGDYSTAHTLLAPEIASIVDVSTLELIWQTTQFTVSGDIQVGEASESGDTATVSVTIPLLGGSSEQAEIPLRKEGGKWYILDPFLLGTGPSVLPTFEPFEIPTFEPVEIPTFAP